MLRNCRVEGEPRHEIHADYPRCAAAAGRHIKCVKGEGSLAYFRRWRALGFSAGFSGLLIEVIKPWVTEGLAPSNKPVFDLQAFDSSELTDIRRYDRCFDCKSMGGDQQIVPTDRTSLLF